ncbi:MAG TPA: hypothetical protein RMF84_02840 [Polyangiaceae bacterium LLY-WYZ-14_1]|nr:hypothetical protein [Polyangiaceae bacterium LLY-WYZ-14_1]
MKGPALLGLALGALAMGPVPIAHGQAVRDLRLDWLTVETRHFVIHYHEPLGHLARRVALVAERAHATLSPLYRHDPAERTQVILTDDTDAANGAATALPRNTIFLFASAPSDLSPLADYDDWMTFLVTHEHTHVLHLDNWSGFPALVNAIFGKVYAPNANAPRWLIEGFAVHEESAHTAGGRLRSSIFDMYLRMDALEGRLLRIDQLSNSVDRWPHGNVWYLYGSYFVEFIADRYGRQVLGEFAEAYGRSLVPYGLNRTISQSTGKSFVALYDEFLATLRERYGRQAARVEAEGRVEGRRVTFHGEITRSPRFIDARRIVYYASDGRDYPVLRTLDLVEGGAPENLARANAEAYVSPTPEGGLVWGTTTDHRDIYFYYDLYHRPAEGGPAERLTEGLRAREPDVSPDGKQVAFTVNGAGTTHLAVAHLADVPGTKRILLRSRRYEQVYTPRWSPDGRTIAVSRWSRGGYRDIHLIDVGSGAVRKLTEDRAFDTGPAWSPDGGTLYWSSDRTGIPNIHAMDLATGETTQVTHVVAGAFSPDVSPDGRRLVYVGYSTYGFDVHVLDLAPGVGRPAAVFPDVRPPASEPSQVAALRSRRYRVVDTLAPQAWSLEIGEDGYGTEVAAAVTGSDAAGFHLYDLRVGVGVERWNVNASGSWTIQRSPAPVTFNLFHTEAPRSDLVIGGARRVYPSRVIGGSANVSYGFRGQFHRNDLSLSYALSHVQPAQTVRLNFDPNDPLPLLPELGYRARLRVRWGFSDVVRTRYDITPSWGRRIQAAVSLADPRLGNEPGTALALTWSATQYVENPWAQYHVLALRYAGGTSFGDDGVRDVFGIGGFPDVAILDQLLDSTFLGGSALRGYPPFVQVGTRFHQAQAEYRFPIARPQVGPQTLPIYLNRLYGNVFVDAGIAHGDEGFRPGDVLVGVGAEVLVDFTLGYRLGYTLRFGFARGLMAPGESQVYGHLGFPF